MQLLTIVQRYAEAITLHDPNAQSGRPNRRTGVRPRPGFAPLHEVDAVRAIDAVWDAQHPGEMSLHAVAVRYPGLRGAELDHRVDEWGIEVKRLQFVGDNGKPNDHAVGKVLSPYLKDRGLIHDALRLRDHGFTDRVAVIAYSFDYDDNVIAGQRRRHAGDAAAVEVIDEMHKVVTKNGGRLHTRPLIEFADAIMGLRGLIAGPRAEAHFTAGANPSGGEGVVFGWEIRRPQLEPGYDPRHPW